MEHLKRILDYQDSIQTHTTSEDGKRIYHFPDGISFPSVTTVLSAVSDHSSLDEWRERVGYNEAEMISNRATERGTGMHSLIEDFYNGKEPVSDNDVSMLLFKALKATHLKKLKPIALELPVYSKQLKVAGRLDCVGYFENNLSIVDFKSSTKPKKPEWIENYFIQCAMYAIALEERTGIWCDNIVVLIGVEQGFPQKFIRKTNEFKEKAFDVSNRYYQQHDGTCQQGN